MYVENGRVVGYDPNDPIRVDYQMKVGTDPTGKENPDLLARIEARVHETAGAAPQASGGGEAAES